MQEIKIKNIKLGENCPLVLIAGPCVIEQEQEMLEIAENLKKITEKLKIPFIFKSSYDKANRLSIKSYRGPGLKKGLKILSKIKKEFDLPILSDIHCKEEIQKILEVLDVIQIPAFLSRQTDLVVAVAKTGKVINIKKAQFLAPWDMKNIVEKITSSGNNNLFITERGSCFGYNNLVVDMCSIPIMQKFGFPVIFDGTHSVQKPGGGGSFSGGNREFIFPLTKAAVAAGCSGIFLEVHKNPDKALCDGSNMLALKDLEELLKQVIEIHKIISKK
ncbi:MAG: 3-deoxy-8-phosphooctulonate synthase [bacterium]